MVTPARSNAARATGRQPHVPDSPIQREWPWTAPQRRALIALLTVLFIVLTAQYFLHPTHISDPQPTNGARADELATQLDPNTATWEELAAIPTLGEKKAKAIVAYREKFLAQRPVEVPFKTAEDLMHVKGIGKAISANLKPYLVFPVASGAPQ